MDPLKDAYDSERFRALGHAAVDLLADYFREAATGRGKVIDWRDPNHREPEWNGIPRGGEVEALSLFRNVVAQSMHLHHPRYMGHQQGPSLPIGALCDLLTSGLSNSSGIYEMGPVGTIVERKVIGWMAESLGLPKTADGFFTSGGSLGNLTGLLAARRQKADDVWNKGTLVPLSVMVSGHAHYSIDRAVRIMGWGADGAVKIPVDAQFRVRPETLEATKRDAEKRGRKIIAVVASCCNTATGTFNPLEPIADFCERHHLWLHVDGAHGASTVLSEKYRPLVAGIERADSVSWDAHKMLMMSALSTGILFRSGGLSYETFSQEASYVLEKSAEREWYNICSRTFETTKRDYALKLYIALQLHGSSLFAEYVTRTYDLARLFADLIRKDGNFELGAEPESNILCFRPRQGDPSRIRKRIVERGDFYLVQTRLPSGVFLRTTLMNPFTKRDDLLALLEAIKQEISVLP